MGTGAQVFGPLAASVHVYSGMVPISDVVQ